MTPIAVTFLLLAVLIVWGGLVASIVYLRTYPEPAEFPAGGEDDHREGDAPIVHDT